MFNPKKNNRGQILVLVAIALVVLIGFAALAIDIGYFYHTKNQLQGAADAAALAGAVKLDGNSTTQTNAKLEAAKYGGLNSASGGAVQLDPTNDNDIAVGYWNSNTFTPNVAPVNAVRVRTRKTTKDAAGFPRIFGRIFDTTKQTLNTEAVAYRPARSSEYISFCADICSAPMPIELVTGPTVTMNGFAWTTLTTTSVSSAANLKHMLCGVSPSADSCGQQIWSTMGADNSVLRVLESLMYNPTYENTPVSKGTDTTTGFTTWTVMAPYINTCPPGTQPTPQTVIGYVVIHIKAICEQGGGGGSVTSVGGPSCSTAYQAPPAACHNGNYILIDGAQCYPCGDPNTPQGYRAIMGK